MLLNIPKNMDDPFYRYKRNSIEIEKLNKKNGIIQIKNLDIIAKQLDRDSEIITKFFRKKLGIPINKKNQISSDKIDVDILEELLEMFISKHILCKTCNNPETCSKTFVCKACGSKN